MSGQNCITLHLPQSFERLQNKFISQDREEHMKIGLISFTEKGQILGERIKNNLIQSGHEVQANTKCKFSQEQPGIVCLEKSLEEWTLFMFRQVEGIIFIGACGIAVRSIAPFIKDKKTDPAVLVVDETGKFCVSLLAGHIGGANELANEIACGIGAIPVITTATDLNQKFAVDVFAKKNGLDISNMTYAKEVSAALLGGRKVGIFSECKLPKILPEGLIELKEEGNLGVVSIYIGIYRKEHEENPFSTTLFLTPKVITVGIGCKKDTKMNEIESLIDKVCRENGIEKKAVKQVASIDLKEKEQGIIEYCNKYELPFVCYRKEELLKVQGEFTASPFVETVTGVDNVCERSAVMGSGQGTLLLKKTAQNGVTVAMAVEEWSVEFE